MLIDIHNKEGQVTGQMELNDSVFGIEPNEHVMHLAVVNYLANQRQGTRGVKNRQDVSGGGKKPWRQKGRGTARAGSTRSPIWVGGGTIHGPKPQVYSTKLPKKVSRLARKSALSLRNIEKNIVLVEDFTFENIKTRDFVQVLRNLKLDQQKTLVMLSGYDNNVYLSGRNIPKLKIQEALKVSTYDILNHRKILLFKGAVDNLVNTFNNSNGKNDE